MTRRWIAGGGLTLDDEVGGAHEILNFAKMLAEFVAFAGFNLAAERLVPLIGGGDEG